MFTGIIQELGVVREIRTERGVHRLSVTADGLSKDVKLGDSISVNGVCLTVVGSGGNEITFEIMDESFRITNLSRLRRSDRINLEPSLRLGDKFGGHLLSGHIDGRGTIRKITRSNQTFRIQIEFPPQFKSFCIVPKGSIAVDGVSLTVGEEIGRNWFWVSIIPHTLKSTTLGGLKAKDVVNIELDIMAKYAQNSASSPETITETFLKERGFI